MSTAPMLAQNWFNTIPMWNGSTFISMFGSGPSSGNSGTNTYGQTITLGLEERSPLQSYSFEMNCTTAAATIRGEVYAWNGTRATGAALWEGAPQTVTAGGGWQLVTVNVGGLTLGPGSYVLFVTTSRDMAAAGPQCTFGMLNTNDPIVNGQFVYINDYTNTAQWTSSAWGQISQDLAFRVDGLVYNVPAASTTSLAVAFSLIVLVGVFVMYRRGWATA